MVSNKTLHHPMGVQIKAYDYSTLQTRYNERLTHRGGLLSIAHFMDSLSLTEPIDQHFPQPKSNPGYRPSEFVETLILMQHEGSFHLDAFIWMIVATFRMMRHCAGCWLSRNFPRLPRLAIG